MRLTRRGFVTGAALAGAAHPGAAAQPLAARREYGRRFTGESLREVAFPLGGLGAGAGRVVCVSRRACPAR